MSYDSSPGIIFQIETAAAGGAKFEFSKHCMQSVALHSRIEIIPEALMTASAGPEK